MFVVVVIAVDVVVVAIVVDGVVDVGKGLTTQPSGHILIPHVGILEETFG
jgi:hypothetical protein